jgi:hypothetical protein
MNHTPDPATAENGGEFDPRQAAAVLDQATWQARRTFAHPSPQLWVYRAVLVLVVFGGCWLSVRGQDPYTGPTRAILPVIFALVAINIAWSVWAIRRAGAGVSGPAERKKHAWIGVMLVVFLAGYAITAPLYHAGASHPVWGLYPASAPMLIIGLAGAAIAAALRYWTIASILLAIAVVAAAAGFGGPAGAWLIMGIGMCAVCLGAAEVAAWQRRRSVIQP